MLEAHVVPILFGVIFVVGLVGNGTLIYTVIRNRGNEDSSQYLHREPGTWRSSTHLSLGAIYSHHLHVQELAVRRVCLQAERVSADVITGSFSIYTNGTQLLTDTQLQCAP